MALSEEAHFAFAKQVALDWRELVREKKLLMLQSPTTSIANADSFISYARARYRTSSMFTGEKRDSAFYRGSFFKPAKELDIQRRAGSMDADRIKVNEELNLYIYPPIPVTEEARASLLLDPISPISPLSAISPVIISDVSLLSNPKVADTVKSPTGETQ